MKRYLSAASWGCAIALMSLGCTVGHAAAAYGNRALYVATNGSDSNDGSTPDWDGTGTVGPLATPGRALQLANDLATSDPPVAIDFIYLRARSFAPVDRRYTITRTLSITKPGLAISTYPADPARAAIVAGIKANSPASVIAVYASGVTVANLEIQGGAYYGIKLDDADGAQKDQAIIGNYIHHTGRDGIKAQRADNVRIEDNEIGPTGVRDGSNAEGIDVIGSIVATIRGNYIHDITTNGLYVKGGTRYAVVEKNLVVNTAYAGILLGSETDAEFIRNHAGNYGDSDGSNPEGHEALDSVARNNIVVNAGMAGVGTVAGRNVEFFNNTLVNVARTHQGAFRAAPNQHGTLPQQFTFKNNVAILDASSSRPLVYLSKACGLTSDHNLWFSTGGPYSFVLDSTPCGSATYSSLLAWRNGTGHDAHSVDLDAAGLQPGLDGNDLYRPLAGSPANDAGTPLATVTDDYLGVPRPQGSGHDVGAQERAVSVASPPSLPAAPLSLDATGTSASHVSLRWSDGNATDDQIGFRIERSADGGKTYAMIAVLPTTQVDYADSDVAPATTYSYRVAAYNGTGISPYSNVDTVKTPRR